MRVLRDDILAVEPKNFLIMSPSGFSELVEQMTEEEFGELHQENKFNGMEVIVDQKADDTWLCKLADKVSAELVYEKPTFRYIDVTAMNLSDKIKFKKHIQDLQAQYNKVFFAPFRQGVYEFVFGSEESAEQFCAAFLLTASRLKTFHPTRKGRFIYVKYTTKWDKQEKLQILLQNLESGKETATQE